MQRPAAETALQGPAAEMLPSSPSRLEQNGGAAMNTPTLLPAGFELHFQSLFNEGRGLAFPCDAAGHVDLDTLSERARCNYIFARRAVGRDFAHPAVLPAGPTLH
jgi:hypothetical protein